MVLLLRRGTDALVHRVAVVRRADVAVYQAVAGGIALRLRHIRTCLRCRGLSGGATTVRRWRRRGRLRVFGIPKPTSDGV